MKKSLLMSFMALMLTAAFAFGQNTLTIGSAEGEAGANVSVAVTVSSSVGVAGASFTVTFDQASLQVASVANGSSATAMTQVGTDIAGANGSGKLVISLVDFSFSNPIAAGDNKEVFVVNFTIASGASGSLDLGLTEVSMSDANAGDIAVTVSGGAITVAGDEPPPPPPTGGGENMLKVSDASGEAGSAVSVQVLLDNDVAVAGASFAVNFDASVLQISTVANGSAASAMTQVGTDVAGANSSGKLIISLVDFSFSNPIAAGADQVVFVVNFTIAAGASGTATLELSDVSLSDANAGDVAAGLQNGTITIGGGGPVVEFPADLTINFTGMTPHVGQKMMLKVVSSAGAAVAETTLTSIPGAAFSLMFEGILAEGGDYNVDFYADLSGNGYYDLPPADHSWRLPVMDVSDNVTLSFAHNTNFTEVDFPMEPAGPGPGGEVPDDPTGAAIFVSSVAGEAGGEVSVSIKVNSTAAIAGASFVLGFSTGDLQIASVAKGSSAAAMTEVGTDVAGANTSGKLAISLVDFSFSNPIAAGDGMEIFVVTFTVASSASGSLPLALSDVSLSDPAAGEIVLDPVSGVIVIGGGGGPVIPTKPDPSTTENFVYVLPVEGDPGSSATATIGMNNIVAVAGLSFNVNFDPAVIQLTAAAPAGKASALTPVGIDVAGANATGVLAVSLVDFSFSSPVATGLDDIFQLSFNFVSGSAASLAATAEFTISDVSASDANAQDVPVGVWTGTPTGDEDIVNPSLPKAYSLSQNAPNPFNPSTTISFEVRADGAATQQVTLNVYNIRGQLVRTLVNEQKPAGRYSIQWNGQDNHGRHISSGVYFYRMQSGDFQQTRKMVLLK